MQEQLAKISALEQSISGLTQRFTEMEAQRSLAEGPESEAKTRFDTQWEGGSADQQAQKFVQVILPTNRGPRHTRATDSPSRNLLPPLIYIETLKARHERSKRSLFDLLDVDKNGLLTTADLQRVCAQPL